MCGETPIPATPVQLDAELKTFAKHLRMTHIYKQQAKHYLLTESPIHILYTVYITVNLRYNLPVTINSTSLMKAINNILNGVRCYSYHCYVIVRKEVLTCDTRASTP